MTPSASGPRGADRRHVRDSDFEHSETQRRFLQSRVALFGKLTSGLWLAGFAAHIAGTPASAFFSQWTALYAGTLAVFLAFWLLCGSGHRSKTQVRIIEVAGLIVLFAMLAAMGLELPSPEAANGPAASGDVPRPNRAYMSLATLYGLSLVAIARAAMVPSSTWYMAMTTFALGLVPLLIFGVFEQPVGDLLGVNAASNTSEVDASTNVITWWSITTLVCAAISTTIYGLRKQVYAARQLGQYTLIRKIGEGGMGVVYHAHHAMMKRPTAIKLLLPERAGKNNLARFAKEVQLTAQLTHPNTITIFDFGNTPDGIFYYAMELLDGCDLELLVNQTGPMPPERVIHIVQHVAAALDEAHDVGLVHRDVKPANIIACRSAGRLDVPKLLDFGLVKQVNEDARDETAETNVVGTPLYMAPEAITAPDEIDRRSDLYSLGAVAYFLLTGTPVFNGKSIVEVCGQHLHTTPEPPSARLSAPLPDDLSAVILSCLRKDPTERPSSCNDLNTLLGRCQHAGQWSSEHSRRWWELHGVQLRSAQRARTQPAKQGSVVQGSFTAEGLDT